MSARRSIIGGLLLLLLAWPADGQVTLRYGVTTYSKLGYRPNGMRASLPRSSGAAPLFDPFTVPNLVIWSKSDFGVYKDNPPTLPCTANGDSVQYWTNRANAGAFPPWLQANATFRPVYNVTGGANGQPRLSFNSSCMTDVSSSAAPYTWLIVGKFTGIVGGSVAPWIVNQSGGGSITAPYLATPLSFGDDKQRINNGTTLNGTLALGGVPGVMVVYFDSAGASSLRVNGAASVSGNAGTGAWSNIGIGGYTFLGSIVDGLIGDIYEVMVFTRALTGTEQTNLEGYCKQKYNLP